MDTLCFIANSGLYDIFYAKEIKVIALPNEIIKEFQNNIGTDETQRELDALYNNSNTKNLSEYLK